MNKKLLLLLALGIFAVGLLAFGAEDVSAYHDYNYGHDGYYGQGYSDTYYKRTTYDYHGGKTVEINRDSPYRSYRSVRTDRGYYRPVHFQTYRINYAPDRSYGNYGYGSEYYPRGYNYGYGYVYRYNPAGSYWRYGW